MSKNKPSVGIIGCGFVGGAIFNGFKYYTDVKVYDKYKRLNSLEDAASQDVLFLCVPTPQEEDGSCDISIVWEALEGIMEEAAEGTPVVIKSTIPPGFCSNAQPFFSTLELIHSPEFLTQRMADIDFATQGRVILGRDGDINPIVEKLFVDVFLSIQVVKCSWRVAAMVKYGLNTFFSTKISFFNELAQICKAQGVDYDEVAELMRNDGRIHRHGMDVPGHDGKPGFGGACFPKDMAALVAMAKKSGVKPTVLNAAMEKNDEVRGSKG